ncbi:MAG TPA: FAD-binding oxidoreductase [Syntrophomonas sp.]|nr:FAD-binding oxidoreductase [Syntrophomonas sp.]
MSTEKLQKIAEQFGDRASLSEFERSFYTRDLAPVPALLVKPLFNTLPDMVVRPQSTEEVAEIMQAAYRDNIPVTPRAGGSTVYFNSVPTKGGILMDLNMIRGVVALDEPGMTVTVKTGTTWSELDEYLNRRGLALKSFPSSAPVATIGGWFCMMGYGIGSMKYGSVLSQIKAAEVVLPDGTVHKLTLETNPALDWFAASEGTLGIVTQLELEVRRLNPMQHYLLHVSDNRTMLEVMNQLIGAEVMPYNLHFTDQECLRAMDALGFTMAGLTSGGVVGVDYEGAEAELLKAQKIVDSLTGAGKIAHPVAQESAELEWEEKFKAMRIKRGGPSVLGAEVWLPIRGLPEYLADVQRMALGYNIGLFSYGHVVTPEYASVMTTFYADESHTIKYIINLSLVKKVHDIGRRYGGCPYGVGLWNSPMVGRIHKPPELSELRRRKKTLDSKGIMNPGKVYRSPFMLNPFNYALGMDVLAGVRKVFGKGW